MNQNALIPSEKKGANFMEKKLELAITAILDALTPIWEDNGNIMADAVRDSVIQNLSINTGQSITEIEKKVKSMVEEAQGA